jgi:hypothetical protein
MKPYNSDSTLGKVDFLYTFEYDEIFQSFNIFDIPKLKFDNLQELLSQKKNDQCGLTFGTHQRVEIRLGQRLI